jgi:hypothetical protein
LSSYIYGFQALHKLSTDFHLSGISSPMVLTIRRN